MSVMSSGRCLTVALAVVLSASACARTPPTDQKGNSKMSEATETARTINGHTYTDTPVDVKLGPNTFRIPANYLDSQIAPWPGEGVSLVIEWPDMKPTPPGARANPRTNDFRKEIRVLIDYVDRIPIDTSLERHVTNDAITDEGSVERGNPADRLDLRIAQPEQLGLIPYAINEALMSEYARVYEARYGRPHPRNPAYEEDWYVARGSDGALTTFIKCDSSKHSGDGLEIHGSDIVDTPGDTVASCTHYIVDIEDSLSISLNYNRVFLKDWKAMEVAIRDVLNRSKVE
ncbi:Smlt3025 familytype IV secretion system inhibitor [Stenotrophomonas rhizophila]|uniref:Smlt3025 familytype IV secretion system inhibitor n=1 Tax=Stenotrophomonas rhizophila TaxID=216778 RepID=UPI0033923ACB